MNNKDLDKLNGMKDEVDLALNEIKIEELKVKILLWIVAIWFMILITLSICWRYCNIETYTITNIEVVQDNQTTLYNCITDTNETYLFSNNDLLFIGKFNSSDYTVTLNRLSNAETIVAKITVRGWRIPIFSIYPNITDIEVIMEVQV